MPLAAGEGQADPQSLNFTEKEVGDYREQDRYLPIANVSRLMKEAVPASSKISKDAKECIQECVSEFISFITNEAAEKCRVEKRKTIGGEDILYAMISLGFDNYAETLRIHLAKLRLHQSSTSGGGSRAAQEGDAEDTSAAIGGDGAMLSDENTTRGLLGDELLGGLIEDELEEG